ncbi:shikimate dehydrogenase [Salisediminibacterium selenitireducens]|uniref:Shikimate dehydrogenase (NADP(+)) n=1 Tax=Bacillus selenitireducens (strain ATCC 700615 / DSM 15326 / MLS10) TaxID=439292 RepID=D6XWD1_BACIE|nr:shikimate dehydrogenase [Salisediminibacterium selenitireducens]ADH99885.1 shikimate 5-dehydrogenase [[Bacillus] selenitireducens MLS10]
MKQIFGVFGDPIEHSMSPAMHEAALSHAGIDGAYHAFHVKPEGLQDAVKGVRALGIRGVNVTIPHKVDVMKHLDAIDPLAERIGAVNTIVNDDGVLTGFNTDGAGYLEGLRPLLTHPLTDMRVLIIGAGGAARAVAMTLASKEVKELYVANRTETKAGELAKACKPYAASRSLTLSLAQARLMEFDLVINTTSVGMSPNVDNIPISLEMLGRDTIVTDLIYNPMETRLLKMARQKGAKTQNGLNMFVLQGGLAFEKWTGKTAPRDIMRQTVLDQLGG